MDQNKIVKFPVWDQETDEIIKMEMDADAYEAMCKAEEEYEQKMKELREYDEQLEREAWQFRRDDD